MSRRRTGARYVPITISLKPSMVDDVETKLNQKQSRSMWIADAIHDKLTKEQFDLVRDGTAAQMLNAFQQKCRSEGVHIDAMMWQVIEEAVGLERLTGS